MPAETDTGQCTLDAAQGPPALLEDMLPKDAGWESGTEGTPSGAASSAGSDGSLSPERSASRLLPDAATLALQLLASPSRKLRRSSSSASARPALLEAASAGRRSLESVTEVRPGLEAA